MPSKSRFLEIMTEDQVRDVHLTALRVLEEVGLWLPNREVLDVLHDAGAHVDFTSQTVRIPPALVEASIRQIPPRFTWHARNPAYTLDINGQSTPLWGARLGHQRDRPGWRAPRRHGNRWREPVPAV